MLSIWKKRGFASLLRPFSNVYEWEISRRNRKFDNNSGASESVPAKVISVGNVTVGGTGKTPLVISLAEWLTERGHEVGVISRGYGRKDHDVLTVSDGHYKVTDPAVAGDEPTLMAARLDEIPVLVGKDRIEAAHVCIEQYGSKILLLDDGFQYRKLRRDLDIVVIDAFEPFGNGWLLPAGPLREPLDSLKRADLIVISRSDEAKMPIPIIEERIRPFTDVPILRAKHWARNWVGVTEFKEHSLESMCGRFCYAFAGIGNPEAFLHTLRRVGIQVVGFAPYRDHHVYTEFDLKRIVRAAERKGAVAILTTEKDGVRLPINWRPRIPIYALRIDLKMEDGREKILQHIDSIE